MMALLIIINDNLLEKRFPLSLIILLGLIGDMALGVMIINLVSK